MPGQTRPLTFYLRANDPIPDSISLDIKYVMGKSPGHPLIYSLSHTFSIKDIRRPHKLTFLHPGGIVSYAIIRAPSMKVCSHVGSERDLPISLHLHGAGVEADNPDVCHEFDSIPDLPSWVLFPTGTTPWSGDDWRAVSFLRRSQSYMLTEAQILGVSPTLKQVLQLSRTGSSLLDGMGHL